MPYTVNPHLPRLRIQAAKLVTCQGWSTRQVAHYTGFDHSIIVRWVKKVRWNNRQIIPPESSRPKRHPKSLPFKVVSAILKHRQHYHRCAEVIHYDLTKSECSVS